MAREIKFRAWDIDNKCFVYLVISHHYINPVIAPSYSGNFEEWKQYTGLKDKNGKEIYEGDRITMTDSSGNTDSGIVAYSDKRATFVIDWGQDRNRLIDPDNNEIIEVIGNIWENPE